MIAVNVMRWDSGLQRVKAVYRERCMIHKMAGRIEAGENGERTQREGSWTERQGS